MTSCFVDDHQLYYKLQYERAPSHGFPRSAPGTKLCQISSILKLIVWPMVSHLSRSKFITPAMHIRIQAYTGRGGQVVATCGDRIQFFKIGHSEHQKVAICSVPFLVWSKLGHMFSKKRPKAFWGKSVLKPVIA